MDQNLFATLYKQYLAFLADNYASQLASDITTAQENGDDDFEETIKASLLKMNALIPNVPVQQASSGVASKPVSRTNVPVLKDTLGRDCKCSGITKKTQLPCKNNAKHIGPNGEHLCGVHNKTNANAQSDANKRPGGVSVNAPVSGISSFDSIIGSTSTNNGYSAFNLDDTLDVDNIADDE